jgi:hypothetical protein
LADARARDRYDEIVDALTSWYPEVRASKVFGMPCLKRSGRVIAGFTRGAMVFKLTDPRAHARALALPGAHLFDPSGRNEPFRQWVVVPPDHGSEWDELAYTALTQDHGTPQTRGV